MTEKTSPQFQATNAPYTFTYRALTEPSASPEGGQYVTALQVEGESRRALLQIVRLPNDQRGPIGLFGDVLSEAQLRAIPAAMDAIAWASLPRPTGGERTAPMLTIEYVVGTRIVRREFNATNGEFLRAISPVKSMVDELLTTLTQKPQRAIDLGVVRTATGFQLVWRNIGSGPVMLADPREPDAPNGPSRGTARVRPAPPPGGFPGPWTTVPLAPSAGPLLPITLAPGATLELDTVPWAAPAPGDYAATASWVDYTGPNVPEQAALPRVPKASQLQDPRPFVIRGGLFSAGVRFRIDKSK